MLSKAGRIGQMLWFLSGSEDSRPTLALHLSARDRYRLAAQDGSTCSTALRDIDLLAVSKSLFELLREHPAAGFTIYEF
jgi:hypothetical protein